MPISTLFSHKTFRLLFVFICFFNAQFSAADTGPRFVVETAAKAMTARLVSDKDKIASQEYYLEQIVDELLLPVVDHKFMAKKVLAKHWRKASREQRKSFTEAFKHKVIRTYAGAFKAFNGETILFEDAKYNKTGKRASVKSEIQRVGAPAINITYLLYLKNDKWLTYDVVIEGVSLVKSFRDQINQSINNEGLAKAISSLSGEYRNESTVLKIAGSTWEPYIGKQLPGNGLAVDLVTQVMKRAGYEVEMEFMPWQRVSEGLENGKVDLSVASWFSETRALESQFTEAYLVNDLMIVKRKNDPLTFNSVAEFKQGVDKKGYRLGAMKDFGYGNVFNEIAPLVSLNQYKYCNLMMRDVASKNTDIALIDHWTALSSMRSKKNIADHLEITQTPLISRNLHATISHRNSQHKEISINFNQALNAMKADGSYNKILEQHSYPL